MLAEYHLRSIHILGFFDGRMMELKIGRLAEPCSSNGNACQLELNDFRLTLGLRRQKRDTHLGELGRRAH